MGLTQRGFLSYDGNHAPKEPFTLNKDSPQRRGLVAWWPVISGGGDILRDFAGHTNGVLNNFEADDWTWNNFGGGALNFDTGEFVDISSIWDHFPSNDTAFTLSTWMNLTDVTTQQELIDIGNGSAGVPAPTQTGFRLLVSGDDIAGQIMNGARHTVITTSNPLSTNTNHLMGFRYLGGGGERSVWVDGKKLAANSGDGWNVHGTKAFLGIETGGANSIQTGKLWDGRVYTHALSDAEIWMLYNPATRWDLYHELGRRTYVSVPAVAAGALNLVMAPYVSA